MQSIFISTIHKINRVLLISLQFRCDWSNHLSAIQWLVYHTIWISIHSINTFVFLFVKVVYLHQHTVIGRSNKVVSILVLGILFESKSFLEIILTAFKEMLAQFSYLYSLAYIFKSDKNTRFILLEITIPFPLQIFGFVIRISGANN